MYVPSTESHHECLLDGMSSLLAVRECSYECATYVQRLCMCLPSSVAPTPQSAEPRPQCTVRGAGGCHRGQGCQQSCGLQRAVMQGGFATTHLVRMYTPTTLTFTLTHPSPHIYTGTVHKCSGHDTAGNIMHTYIRTYMWYTYVHTRTQRALQCCTNMQYLRAPAEVTETQSHM